MKQSPYFELVIYQLVKKFLPMKPHSQEVTSGFYPKQNESSPYPFRFEINYNISHLFCREQYSYLYL
jgi:hypothetical protein